MIAVTTNDLPGYRAQAVLAEVMCPTVRSTAIGASCMVHEAEQRGADVIVEPIAAGQPGAPRQSAQHAPVAP